MVLATDGGEPASSNPEGDTDPNPRGQLGFDERLIAFGNKNCGNLQPWSEACFTLVDGGLVMGLTGSTRKAVGSCRCQ